MILNQSARAARYQSAPNTAAITGAIRPNTAACGSSHKSVCVVYAGRRPTKRRCDWTEQTAIVTGAMRPTDRRSVDRGHVARVKRRPLADQAECARAVRYGRRVPAGREGAERAAQDGSAGDVRHEPLARTLPIAGDHGFVER